MFASGLSPWTLRSYYGQFRQCFVVRVPSDRTVGSCYLVLAVPTSTVEFPVPFHKPPNTFSHRCPGPEPSGLLQTLHVCIRGRDVARLHWEKALLRFLSKRLFEQTDHLQQLHWLMVAYVVEP